mgnify:CR=1 FL=1
MSKKLVSIFTSAALIFTVFCSAIILSSAETAANSDLMIDFDDYIVTENALRGDLGTFSIEANVADSSDGSVLSYVRNSDVSNSSRANNALYMFMLNRTGAANAQGALSLKSGGNYQIKIRYKITNPNESAANQIWQFRLCTTKDGKYIPQERDQTGTNMVRAFTVTGNTEGFVSETYYFDAPTYADGASVSLIGSFVPTTNTYYDGSNNISGDLTGWQVEIDYIYFKKVDVMNIGFEDYVISADGVRSDCGTFSVVEDAEAEDGYALHYQRSSTASGGNYNNPALYLFEANISGSTVKAGSLSLTAGTTYNATVRFKISGGTDSQKWQFRLLHTTNNNYKVKDRDNTIARIMKVFQRTGNTDGYVTGTFTFTATERAENVGLLAALIPVSNGEVNLSNVQQIADWSWSIDTIKFEEADYDYIPQHMKIDFTDWAAEKGENRNYYETDTTATEWSTVTEGANKYIRLSHTADESRSNYVYYSVLMNPTGTAAAITTNADYGQEPYFSLEPGARYRISFKYKLDTATGAVPCYILTTANEPKTLNLKSDARSDEYGILTATDEWKEYTFEFIAKAVDGAVCRHMGLSFFTSGIAEKDFVLSLDDVTVDRLTEVTFSDVLGNSYFVYGAPAATGYYKDAGISASTAEAISINSSKEVGGYCYYSDAELTQPVTDTQYFTTKSAAYSYKLNGESNLDGVIDIRDLVHIKKDQAAEETTPLDDVNCDGSTDSGDLISLRKYLLGDLQSHDLSFVLSVDDYHPGVPGYDVSYTFSASSYGAAVDSFTLSCSEPEILIDGNSVTVPASFKDTTSKKFVTVIAAYGNKTADYELKIVNWGEAAFDDEFEGKSIDSSKWSSVYRTRTMEDGNSEVLSDRYCYLSAGNLVMPVVKENDTYYSAELRTDYTFNQTYGCFTVRMKGPGSDITSGANNAFWLLPSFGGWGNTYLYTYDGSQLACGELDVVERSAYWGYGMWNTTQHIWNSVTGEKVSYSRSVNYTEYDSAVNGGFIEYTLAWTKNAIFVYANGQLISKTEGITGTGMPAYMILSNAINSATAESPAWTGYTTDDNLDDLTVYVDYIKAYALN